MNSIKEHVEYFGISGHVIGMSQDTTATNVGREKGTFRRYCQEIDTCLLRVDCRRHIVELEVKHFAVPVTGRNTSAPGDALFKRYRDKFDTIRPEIKYTELVTFKWPEEGTLFHRKASESLLLMKKLLNEMKFERGDYLELTKLVYIFLTGEVVINGKEFHLSKPHNVSHARFMQRGLYYVTLQILGDQASYMNYTEAEQREVELMAEFTALFYTPRFLRSSLPAEAPVLDLQNIRDLRALCSYAQEELNKDPDNEKMRVRLEAAENCLDNIYLHPDYVTPQNIVFSLAGDLLEHDDKKVIATSLWGQLQEVGGNVQSFPFHTDLVKKTDICSLWPEDKQWPDLSKFVSHYSLLLFFHLNMANDQSLSWLTQEPEEWHKDVEYCVFQDFVKKIDVTNDCAERQVVIRFYFLFYRSFLSRSVKLAQDFIKEARQEAGLQNTYRVVAHGRRIAKSNKWGKRSKAIMKNLNL